MKNNIFNMDEKFEFSFFLILIEKLVVVEYFLMELINRSAISSSLIISIWFLNKMSFVYLQ